MDSDIKTLARFEIVAVFLLLVILVVFLITLLIKVDFKKGAIFDDDSIVSYIFEGPLYTTSYLLAPKESHRIKYEINKAIKNSTDADTLSVDIQQLFHNKIDNIYVYNGWLPSFYVTELIGIDYHAMRIKEHSWRIILVADRKVLYHEDFPSEKGYYLTDCFEQRRSIQSSIDNTTCLEGHYSTTLTIVPNKLNNTTIIFNPQ